MSQPDPQADLYRAIADVMRAEQRAPTAPDIDTPPAALVALGDEAVALAGYAQTEFGWWREPCPAAEGCRGGCALCGHGTWRKSGLARPAYVRRRRAR